MKVFRIIVLSQYLFYTRLERTKIKVEIYLYYFLSIPCCCRSILIIDYFKNRIAHIVPIQIRWRARAWSIIDFTTN